VRANGTISCALLSDGRVRCWGRNASGPLGTSGSATSSLDPVTVGSLTGITKLAVGSTHVCAINGSNQVYCWGDNASRQLYTTNAIDQSTPVLAGTGFTSLALGTSHTCGTKQDGSIVCWGSDANGQRGDGAGVASVTTMSGPAALTDVDKLVAGAVHTCALKDGVVYCWGSNNYGQIGDGTNTQQHAPVEVPGMTDVTDIAAGSYHTCAVKGGNVYCWGYGLNGQLGNGATQDRTSPTQVPGLANAATLYAGASDTCAKRANNAVVCWGANGYGQLGNDTNTSTLSANAALTGGGSLTNLALGSLHSCALAAGGEVRCWGYSGNYATALDQTVYTPTEISW
jgi:alpha-tubulin suppressor-like RCC1 family protein